MWLGGCFFCMSAMNQQENPASAYSLCLLGLLRWLFMFNFFFFSLSSNCGSQLFWYIMFQLKCCLTAEMQVPLFMPAHQFSLQQRCALWCRRLLGRRLTKVPKSSRSIKTRQASTFPILTVLLFLFASHWI